MKSEKPMRKCIGCNNSKEKSTLTRIVLKDGKLYKDTKAVLPGRGVYVCGPECLSRAISRNAFQRSFKCAISKDVLEQIQKEFAD